MDRTVIIIIIVSVDLIAIAIGAVLLYKSLHFRSVERTIVALIGRKGAIVASSRALRSLVERLSTAPEEELLSFDIDPLDDERRAFGEVASQMRITEDELKNINVMRSLESVIISMEDAARLIFEAAAQVDGAGESEALSIVAQIDLTAMDDAVSSMEIELHDAAQRNHVDDSSVYGGGLYI